MPPRVAADATRIPLPFSISRPLPTGPLSQLGATLDQLLHDPFGTVVGSVRQQFSDLKESLFSLTPEELANPIIRARIMALGVDPDKMGPTATSNQVALAQGRTMALLVGAGAAALTGGALPAAMTMRGAAGKGAAEALAFGTVGGAVTPVEEGQTRAGNILTWNALGVPFGTAGGVTSFALRQKLTAQGIKPELEAPEITPTPRDFDPRVAAEPPRGMALVRRDPDMPAPPPPPPPGGPEVEIIPPQPRLPGQTVGTPVDRVVAALSIDERPVPPARTLKERADAAYTRWVDDQHPINRATVELLKLRDRNEKILAQRGEIVPWEGRTDLTAGGWRGKKTTPGVRLPGLEDPYVLARLTRGATGKATQFLEHGPLDWTTLQPALHEGSMVPGFREILRPIVEQGLEKELRAFLVSPRALELANRGIKTPIPVDAAMRVIQEASPETVHAALSTFRYTDATLQYAVDSGVIPLAQADLWRSLNKHYVPFYQVVSEIGDVAYPGGPGTTMGNVGHGVKKILGGAGKVVDPLENIVKNTYAMVSVADRYAVGDALVKLAESAPDQQIVRRVTDISPQAVKSTALQLKREFDARGIAFPEHQIDQIAQVLQPTPEGTFWVWRNNQKVYYAVDPPLYRALMNMDREQSGTLMKLLSYPASLQRAGFTTLSPTFPVRNPIRDQFSAAIFSRFGFKPGHDLVRGVFNVLNRTELYQKFQQSGGEHAVLSRMLSSDRVAAQASLRDLLNTRSPLARKIGGMTTPEGFLEAARSLSEISEAATRMMETTRAKQATGDARLAGFAGREVSLDFPRMGYATREANRLMPFFNPAIQDLDKIARTFGAEGGKRAASAGAHAAAAITLPTLMLYLLNRNDPNFQELSEARKDFFWNIPLWHKNPETGRIERSGNFLTIPKPFLQGLIFGSVPERIFRWVDKQDPDAFNQLAEHLIGSATPPLMPAVMGPAIEAATNYDFFRQGPIIPASEQRLIAEEQAGELQGETVRLIGKALDVSPRLVDHVLKGYTGGASEQITKVTDAALRLTGVKSPESGQSTVEQIPVLSKIVQSFLVEEPTLNSKSVQKFYQDLGEIEATMATLRNMAKEGRGQDANNLAREFRTEIAAYQTFIQTNEQIGQLRAAIAQVRSSTQLSRAEREEKALMLGRTVRKSAQIANDVYRRLKERFREQDEGVAPQTGGFGVTIRPVVP